MHDYLVFIGRFQPFHNAHLRMVQSALARGKRLILLVGTADAPRSSRNPWTFAEREAMIRAALNAAENARTDIRPLHDDPYHDDRWVAQVEATVAAVLAAHGTSAARVGLFGHEKDASSFYLRLFPQWDYVAEADTDGISATPIRRRYFLLQDDKTWDEPQLPPAVAAALPDSAPGLLVGGDPDATVETVAVSGGAGDSLLAAAREAGADVFLTADLRHHPATDHLEGGRPHLLCGTHWATEWVGLPPLAARLEAAAGERGRRLEAYVSEVVTDPWTLRLSTGS